MVVTVGCSQPNPEACCTTADQCLMFGLPGLTSCDAEHVCSMEGNCITPTPCTVDADCHDPAMVCNMNGQCVPEGDGSGSASQYTLTVQIAGSGHGSITSAPAGITCTSGTCTGVFDTGTQVQLTQTPTSGSFLGWTTGCSGKNSCAVTLDKDAKVGAMFGAPGEVLWAKQFGGSADDLAYGVASTSDGNLIIVGGFEGMVVFGTVNLSSTSATIPSMFVAKLDGLTGAVIWARSYAGEYGQRVALDSTDNIYVAGSFEGTIDLGTGNVLSSGGLTDTMIVKLGPSGDPIWSIGISGPSDEVATSISVKDDHVAVVGTHSGVTIGTHTYPTNGDVDMFMVDLSYAGDIRWSRSIGGAGHDIVGTAQLDSVDNLVVDGGFSQPIDFGMGTVTPAGGDLFVARLDGTTGATTFAQHYGAASATAVGDHVALDAADNILVAGRVVGTVDFGGGHAGASTSTKLTAFSAKYSPTGTNIWVRAEPMTSGASAPTSALVTQSGDFLYAGVFCGAIRLYVTDYTSTLACPVQPGVVQNDAYNAQLYGASGVGVSSMSIAGTADKAIMGLAESHDLRRYEVGRFGSQFSGSILNLGDLQFTNAQRDAFVFGLAP
jgi:hypothetical protein